MDLVLCRGRASFHGSTVVYALIMTKETQDFRLLIQDSSDNSNAMDILTNSSLTRVLVLYVENCIVVSKSLGKIGWCHRVSREAVRPPLLYTYGRRKKGKDQRESSAERDVSTAVT
ncbi:PREDICTED: uncharacterized protein LOC106306697 isoform X2 [Brassica oleracea var. oleracea]|uniref:uncharacterized protein LOC106306697 isoform X2 n=1 Tax=Brassica oleracea var. oleracea TaxID=109376 RepID=UPI0006A6DD30|nr:PREDICTED: uncharacterized protein LOC106306697 isoform X2 [Brassica oleracea var. oleracea]